MPKVIGNAWDAFPQFHFADKLGMESSQIPNNPDDVIQALMVGNKYYWNIPWNGIPVLDGICRP